MIETGLVIEIGIMTDIELVIETGMIETGLVIEFTRRDIDC